MAMMIDILRFNNFKYHYTHCSSWFTDEQETLSKTSRVKRLPACLLCL